MRVVYFGWQLIYRENPEIKLGRFNTTALVGKKSINVIMFYAPINEADEEKKEECYTIQQTTMTEEKERLLTISME